MVADSRGVSAAVRGRNSVLCDVDNGNDVTEHVIELQPANRVLRTSTDIQKLLPCHAWQSWQGPPWGNAMCVVGWLSSTMLFTS